MEEPKITESEEYIALKAQYDNAVTELDSANKKINELTENEKKLNRYIAQFVSTNTKPTGAAIETPKTFNELYNETIRNLAKE